MRFPFVAAPDKERIMTDKKQPKTVNRGPAGENRLEKAHQEEFEVAGNVRRKGEDPSPDDRERGERSEADPKPPIESGR